jgi:hypothetical protein
LIFGLLVGLIDGLIDGACERVVALIGHVSSIAHFARTVVDARA